MEGTLTRAARGLCLGWMLTVGSWAQMPHAPSPSRPQPRSVTFLTQPSGARLTDQFGSYLGDSGQPIVVDKNKYGSILELTVVHPDCENFQWMVKTPELDAGTVPTNGSPVRLPLRPNWVTQAGPALAFVLLGAGLMGFWVTRKGTSTRERQRRQVILSEVDQSDSLAAKKIGPYRLLQRLGVGGMATVYRAVLDATMDESEALAVKVLRRDAYSDSELMDRFRREALVTSKVNHPNIVRLVDWGEEDGYAYLAMELIEGGNLRERLNHQAVTPADAWEALRPICLALSYAHSKGIVHRDLKPENLMITSTGLLKVTDFGLARGSEYQKVTATGSILGTPSYMAPEQIHGETPDASMDQYALGVIAYELLTGRVPFEDPDPVRQIFKTLSEPAPPPSRWLPLSVEIDGVVLRMLEKDPGSRFPNIQAAADALQQALTNQPGPLAG